MDKCYKGNTMHLQKLAAVVLASSLAAVGTVAVLPGTPSVAQAATTGASTSKSAIHVQVEGKAVSTQGLLSKTGKTLVPLKDAAKAFGASVTYDAKTHQVTVKKDKASATYEVYSETGDNGVFVSFNGGTIGDSYDGQVIKGVSYVEIKALSEPFGYRALWNNSTHTVNLTQAGINNVTVTPTTWNAKAGNDYTNINIVYPVVSGLDNTAAQTAINKALKAHFDEFLAAVQKQAKEFGAPTNKDMSYEIDGGYKVTYNQNGVISFLLTDYQFLGGAHGDDILTGMTFSLKDGKPVKLDDLLKSNTSYRQDLKKLLQADIRKHADDMGVSLEQFNDLSKSSSKYLDNYYLTDSGFNVFFQKYDIAPGAAGNPEFEFTFSQLLKSDSNPLSSYK
ncbi:PdaC/SigV domain-containing protein [Paenibacillus sp. WLX2291]|uniref:PdaC/SigV domain-containing protein n=1 Tax=Paenibacillus sp. WLX2291 TaxID=3296934 RepID=UPI00398428BB